MKLSRSSLHRFLIGLALVLFAAALACAQQTIIANSGQVGVAYTYPVTSSATPPVQYTATGLPAGLAINASSGLITGIPTVAGTSIGDVSVTSGGQTNHAAISITIAAAANTPVIDSAATATGTVGVAFTYDITSTPAAASYNIPALPAGLTANTTTGHIGGTPSAVGTYPIVLSGNNASGTGPSFTLTLTVAAPAGTPVIDTSGGTSASVAVGASFSYTITATNTPTSFAASGLPFGLSVDTATGAISGTPTVAGVYIVGLTAANANGTSPVVNLTLTVGALPVINSPATVIAAVGVPFTYSTTADVPVTSYNISGLPAWLASNTTSGLISGTPTAVGTVSLSLSANNATGTGPVKTLTITVGNRPAITSPTSASGTVGSAFTYNVTANNAPTSYTVSGLPAGLSANAGGLISGTPTVSGSFSVSLSATNEFGTGPVTTLNLTIASSGGGGPTLNPPTITSAGTASAVLGVPFSFAVTTSPTATQFGASGLPAGVTIDVSTGVIAGTFTVLATHSVNLTASNSDGSTNQTLTITVNSRPAFTAYPQSGDVQIGGNLVLGATITGSPTPTYQWYKDGAAIAGATGPSLTLGDFQVGDAGSYALVLTNVAGSATSKAAIIGVSSTARVAGTGRVVGADIGHPNGNIYDQVLLTGTSATITADAGKITRMSFIDLDDDIVQVEMSGAGTLTLTLESPAGPAAPLKYNQPGVTYMKGHASLFIVGADETTHLTVFSVGPLTAVDQTLFRAGETYDGIADLGVISIASAAGKFAGIRTGNVCYFRAKGQTGIYAPGVAITGATYIGEIAADADATPVMIFGSTTDVRITGGELLQANNHAVRVEGISHITFTAGVTSHSVPLPKQANRARFERDGVDVTDELLEPIE